MSTEEHLLLDPQGVLGWLCLSLTDNVPGWFAHAAKHGGAQTDEVGRLLGRRRAITDSMDLIEPPLDRVPILAHEEFARQLDRHRMLLADVAHVRRALDDNRLRPDGGGSDRSAPLLLHRGIEALNFLERHLLELAEARSHIVVAEVAEEHAVG